VGGDLFAAQPRTGWRPGALAAPAPEDPRRGRRQRHLVGRGTAARPRRGGPAGLVSSGAGGHRQDDARTPPGRCHVEGVRPALAVASGVKDVREHSKRLAGASRAGPGHDPVRRRGAPLNKSQQDVLLPGVEDGLVASSRDHREPVLESTPRCCRGRPLAPRAALRREIAEVLGRGLAAEDATADDDALAALIATPRRCRAALTPRLAVAWRTPDGERGAGDAT